MMKLIYLAACGAIVALASTGPSSAQSPPMPMPVTGPGHSLVLKLNTQNASDEAGTATLLDTTQGLSVSMRVAGGNAAGPQPNHIHTGTCAQLGGVKYPLKPIVSGMSDTLVPGVTIADLVKGTYAINVHKSAAEAGTYTACGNVTAPT